MAIFYNRATLIYNGQSRNSNQVSGEILPSITMTKTAISASYSLGDAVAYVISLVNTGTQDINNLTLTDDLGAYSVGNTAVVPLTYRDGSVLFYIDGILQPAPSVSVGTGLVISGIDIPAGSNAIIIYEAIPNAYAPLAAGSEITNTVTACSGCGDLSDSATIPVSEEADLSIAKSLCPEVITDCSITYTFIIQNSGNTPITAEDCVIVTDLCDPILKDIDVTLNGEELNEGCGYSYNECTGEFSTNPGVITVDAASFTQDPETGLITVVPGVSILTVSGRLCCSSND